MIISQPSIDKIKSAYKTIDDVKKSSVWGNMTPDMQQSLSDIYTAPIVPTMNTNTSTTGSFVKAKPTRTDSQGRQFTQAAYDAQVKAGNDISGFKKIGDTTNISTDMNAPQMDLPETKFSTDSFKKLADDNMKVQLAKNEELQKTLTEQKAAADLAFEPIKAKFDTNQTAALKNIKDLEDKRTANYNAIQEQNKKYYTDQSAALDAQLGGEQAGVSNALQAKGINAGVIGNAISQVKDQHQAQYNALLKNNADIANQLNNSYLSFVKDIQSQRDKWSTDEIALLKTQFDYGKSIIDESKTLDQNMINSTYKPYQDALDQVSTAEATAANYQARDDIDINRYTNGTAEQRKLLLMARLGLDSPTNAYGTTTNFDAKLLDEAAKQPSLSEAIRMLGKTYQATKTSGTTPDSAVIKAVAATINKASPSENKATPVTNTTTPTNTTTTNTIGLSGIGNITGVSNGLSGVGSIAPSADTSINTAINNANSAKQKESANTGAGTVLGTKQTNVLESSLRQKLLSGKANYDRLISTYNIYKNSGNTEQANKALVAANDYKTKILTPIAQQYNTLK